MEIPSIQIIRHLNKRTKTKANGKEIFNNPPEKIEFLFDG